MHAFIINQQVTAYPYSVDQLRKDSPQTSFPRNPTPELLATFNVFPVKPTEHPAYDPMTQRVEEGTPVLQAGEWVQVWNVTPLSSEEIAQQQMALQDSIVVQTQRRLDDFARTRNYDGILSACTYATSTVPKFSTEGQYCVEARDATWAALYQILADVQAGTRPAPAGFADIEGDLPTLAWPN